MKQLKLETIKLFFPDKKGISIGKTMKKMKKTNLTGNFNKTGWVLRRLNETIRKHKHFDY